MVILDFVFFSGKCDMEFVFVCLEVLWNLIL